MTKQSATLVKLAAKDSRVLAYTVADGKHHLSLREGLEYKGSRFIVAPSVKAAVAAVRAATTAPVAAPSAAPQVPAQEAGGVAALRKRASNGRPTPTGTAAHLIIEALAGTGKTTTGIAALKEMRGSKFEHTPSEQQLAIFQAFAKSSRATSIAMVAFNKSIATELQNRVPNGVDAMTMHSMGLKAVRAAITLQKGRDAINGWNVRNILERVTGKSTRKMDPVLVQAVEKLVGLCKTNLVGEYDAVEEKYHVSADQLDALTSRFDIETNGHRTEVYDLVGTILGICASASDGASIDFNDMIWLPVIRNWPIRKYDLLFVDEAQDLNPCQQELAIRAGKRLIFCGDKNQAIYGFTGADSTSLDTLYTRLSATDRGCQRLPLTVTRRCGKNIVKAAQKYVAAFEAHESNGEGLVTRRTIDGPPFATQQPVEHQTVLEGEEPMTGGTTVEQTGYRYMAKDGDMVLCRTNAPLVQECFKFLKEGRKAQIQGRDIGQQLANLVKKLKADSVQDLVGKVDAWRNKEISNEQAKKNPSENRIIAISDRADCVVVFCEDANSVADVLAKIESIFSDKAGSGILLSSIHKAKGLEADTVFFINNKSCPCPHPMSKQLWSVEQEFNLLYVGITRARNVLVHVA